MFKTQNQFNLVAMTQLCGLGYWSAIETSKHDRNPSNNRVREGWWGY